MATILYKMPTINPTRNEQQLQNYIKKTIELKDINEDLIKTKRE